MKARSENITEYRAASAGDAGEEARIIAAAERILEKQVKRSDPMLDPFVVRKYLRLHFFGKQSEVFSALLLDNRHRLIELVDLFHGTIDGCSVHAREVVKETLRHNAAAVIFAHNHPSGVAEPSDADRRLTQQLKEALALIDVRVLDHFVVGESNVVSFAERGFL